MTRRKQRETGGRALKIEGNANTKALKWKESLACSKDRKKAGKTVPPQGLYLNKVYYDEVSVD